MTRAPGGVRRTADPSGAGREGPGTMTLMVGTLVIFCWLGLTAREFDRALKWRLAAAVAALVLYDLATGIA